MASTTTATIGVVSGPVTAHCIRLGPGDDLVPSLQRAAAEAMAASRTASAFVMTAVGSLSDLTLRTASAPIGGVTAATESSRGGGGDCGDQKLTRNGFVSFEDPLEVVSLVGTFALDASKHLHMTVADAEARTFGGHVVSGKVYTTLELVLGTVSGVSFRREHDQGTGYRELVVEQSSGCQDEPQQSAAR